MVFEGKKLRGWVSHCVLLPCEPNVKFTFSCALVSLFWTLMASFPAVTPFPVSAMSRCVEGSPAVCRTSEEEEAMSLKERPFPGA